MRAVWKWIACFAYRRAVKGQPVRKPPVGLPFMRDPENRCHAYEPRPRELGDFRDCQTDGHYLCRECCHRDPTADVELIDTIPSSNAAIWKCRRCGREWTHPDKLACGCLN